MSLLPRQRKIAAIIRAILRPSHNRKTIITLQASSVRYLKDNIITYDLGWESVKIIAESPAARQFVAEVEDRRCGAHVTVTLTPIRNSPFNTTFKASRPER